MKLVQKAKKKSERPRYNLWQNTGYMIAKAWRTQKSVPCLCVVVSVLGVLENLVGLFIAPGILGKVEAAVALPELLWTIAGFAAALMACRALNSYVETNTMFARIEIRVDVLMDMHRKTAETSYPNTENPQVLQTLDKARKTTNGNNSAAEAIWNTLSDLLKNLLGFVIYLLLLSSLDPLMMLVVVATTMVGYLASKQINEWGYRHRKEEEAYIHKSWYLSEQSRDTTLAKDIRIFGMRPWIQKVHKEAIDGYQAFQTKGEKIYFGADAIDVLLSLLRSGIAYGYLIALTLARGLPASQFLLYFTAVSGFTSWVTGILTGFGTLHKQCLELSTMREYLDTPELFKFEEGESLEPVLQKDYELRLNHVSFRYPGAEEDTIHNMSLTIRPGEKLAIVGLNGAGKTTLVKLLCGFYDPTEGEVLLNGEDIRRYNRRDYYRHFAAVFQQFSVLEATVAENVAQTPENIDLKKVDNCLMQAGLDAKVQSLPQGVETHIGRQVFEDGVQLSGGETQRLMLARALYKDAPIIVLDEPTAALDPIAEDDIYHKYNELTAGRTSLYISHRLASTRFCDRIIYLEKGVIAEEGTHASLLALGGKYAELFQVQSRYYKEGGLDHEQG